MTYSTLSKWLAAAAIAVSTVGCGEAEFSAGTDVPDAATDTFLPPADGGDATTTDSAHADSTVPDGSLEDVVVPDGSLEDVVVPDGSLEDVVVPDAPSGDVVVPDAQPDTPLGPPVLTLTPSDPQDFGTVKVGDTTKPISFTVKNEGQSPSADLSLKLAKWTPSGPNIFEIRNQTCPSALEVDATCTFDVVFTPPANGNFSDQLLMSEAGTAVKTVQVQGVGGSPSIDVSEQSVNFDIIATPNSNGVPHTLTVKNVGSVASGAISVGMAAGSIGFSIDPNSSCLGTSSLPVNGTCDVIVLFDAQQVGNYSGTVNISDSLSSKHVPVQGVIAPPATVTITPSPYDFKGVWTGEKATRIFTVTNGGGITAENLNIRVSPTTNGFSVASNNCGSSLLAGNNCQVTVKFAPTSAGFVQSALLASWKGSTVSATSILKGTGLWARWTVTPNPGKFGDVPVGTTKPMSFVLKNEGNGAEKVALTSTSQRFTVDANNQCNGRTIPGGGTCTFVIAYTPAVTHADAGKLQVRSTHATALDVDLYGNGILAAAPALDVKPDSFYYGKVTAGEKTTPKLFTVTNTGTADAPQITLNPSADLTVPFSTDHCSGSTLPPGAQCSFIAYATPTKRGVTWSGSISASETGGAKDTSTMSADTRANDCLIYVKAGSSGVGQTGAPDHPYSTISKALQSLPSDSAGCVVLVEDGSYGESSLPLTVPEDVCVRAEDPNNRPYVKTNLLSGHLVITNEFPLFVLEGKRSSVRNIDAIMSISASLIGNGASFDVVKAAGVDSAVLGCHLTCSDVAAHWCNGVRLTNSKVRLVADTTIWLNDKYARGVSGLATDVVAENLTVQNQNSDDQVFGLYTRGMARITGSKFKGMRDGIVVASGGKLILRDTQITNYRNVAVSVQSNVVDGTDLGRDIPGNNTFEPLDLTAPRVALEVQTGVRVFASGNEWKHNVQGADSNGNYTTQTVHGIVKVTNNTQPYNYTILDSSGSIEM